MSENMFAPEMGKEKHNLPEEEQDTEKRIRFEVAKEDGQCQHCKGEYKKGEGVSV